MVQSGKLFENFLEDIRITPSPLSNFACDTLNNLIANNSANEYDALIKLLTPLLTNFQGEIGEADTNHAERSANRTALELGLITAVHTIAAKFPGDVQQCLKFFQFNLLFAQTKHKHKNYSGSVAADATVEVLNRLFTDTATITIRNPDDNAGIFVWLAPTPNAPMPSAALEILPGNAHEVKPSQLGPLANPFLLVHNSSGVNEGAFEVEVVG